MPGLQRPYFSSTVKKLALLSCVEGKEQAKGGLKKKVRIIYADPDATESSSDELDDEAKRGLVQKRLQRELLIPATCLSWTCEEILEKWSNSPDAAPVAVENTVCDKALPKKKQKQKSSARASSKGTQKKWLYQHTSPSQRPRNRVGVRQRKWGKWMSEFRDPSQGLRIWLGTFDSAQETALASDNTASHVKGPIAITKFSGASQTSSGSLSSDSLADISMPTVDDNELLPLCCELDGIDDSFLVYSPSSVLEHPNSSESCFLASSPSSGHDSGLSDHCSAAVQASDALVPRDGISDGAAASKTPDKDTFVNLRPDVLYGSLEHPVNLELVAMDDTPLFDVFGELDSCTSRGGSPVQATEYLSEDEAARFMAFELDAEALAWINIQG